MFIHQFSAHQAGPEYPVYAQSLAAENSENVRNDHFSTGSGLRHTAKKNTIRVMINEEVFAFLLEQVEATKRIHQEAKRKFWAVAGKPRETSRFQNSPPSNADGSELVRKAVAEENFAMRAHIEAMMRLNRYLLDGTIPHDLPPKVRKKSASAGPGGSAEDEHP